MINRLQQFMRKSKVYEQIFEADEEQLRNRNERVDDLCKQLSVDTATWGLPIHEQEYGISVDETKPYSERRALIKSKMRGSGIVTADLIKSVALAFTGGEVDVGFDGDILIEFTNIYGIPENMDDFKSAINNIKPAHLDVYYSFLYAVYRDLIDHNYTYQNIVDLDVTYEDILSGGIT